MKIAFFFIGLLLKDLHTKKTTTIKQKIGPSNQGYCSLTLLR